MDSDNDRLNVLLFFVLIAFLLKQRLIHMIMEKTKKKKKNETNRLCILLFRFFFSLFLFV